MYNKNKETYKRRKTKSQKEIKCLMDCGVAKFSSAQRLWRPQMVDWWWAYWFRDSTSIPTILTDFPLLRRKIDERKSVWQCLIHQFINPSFEHFNSPREVRWNHLRHMAGRAKCLEIKLELTSLVSNVSDSTLSLALI